jgi:hypothetical protein
MRTRCVLVALVATALVQVGRPAAAAHDAMSDATPAVWEYEEALAPYGSWADHDDYGPVWLPAVPHGWRPYADGQWVWGPDGWTWLSHEPWAWTFHYGRWALVPAWGWAWVPGFAWAPAWVDWYWDDGFVGWAPLPPGHAYVPAAHHYVFVPVHHFCAPRVIRHVVHHHDVPRHHWRHRRPGPPHRDRVERVSRHPIPRMGRRPPGTVAPTPRLGPRRRGHDGRIDLAPRRPDHPGGIGRDRLPRGDARSFRPRGDARPSRPGRSGPRVGGEPRLHPRRPDRPRARALEPRRPHGERRARDPERRGRGRSGGEDRGLDRGHRAGR